MEKSKPFVVYCVYENPADFPGKFVARRWVGMDPDYAPAAVSDTLEGVHRILMEIDPNLIRAERNPGDDPVIVETWL